MSDPLLDRFETERARGVLADAYLMLGPSRRRLRELALDAAARVLDCRGAVGEHADFVLFDPQALGITGLKVEHIAVRDGDDRTSVEAQLRYRPLQGKRRVVVLLDADHMTADAQAALLKTAEEPPPGTLFLLTAVEQSTLLPALRSRCRTYRAGAPPAAELARRAAAAGIEAEDWALLCQAAGRGETALDWDAQQRQQLLALHTLFRRWMLEGGGGDWLRLPQGTLAEQRISLHLEWSACLGWLGGAYANADPALALRLDQLAGALAEALAELAGQLAPGLLVEALQKEVFSLSLV